MLTEDKITEIFGLQMIFCKVLMRCSVAEVFRRFVRTGSGNIIEIAVCRRRRSLLS